MSDLISRQEVLNELDGCDYELKDWQRWKLKTMVRDIPSAQPTQTNADSTQINTLDCVSRKSVIDAIMGQYPDAHYPQWYVKIIEKLPSAQPERKRGRWIEKENSPFYCSVCGTYQYSASWEIKNKEYNFCPRCGADMRGESDES